MEDLYGLSAQFSFNVSSNTRSNLRDVRAQLGAIESSIDSLGDRLQDSNLGSQLGDQSRQMRNSTRQTTSAVDALEQEFKAVGKTLKPLKREFKALRKEVALIDFGEVADDEQFNEARQSVYRYVSAFRDLRRQIQGATTQEREFAAVLERQQRTLTSRLAMQEQQRTASRASTRQGEFDFLRSAGRTIINDQTKESVRDAIQLYASFDDSVARVQSISRANQEDIARLRKKAIDLGASTRFTAKQVSDAESFLAMAGFDADDILAGINSVLDLNSVAGSSLDLASTADIASDVLSGFQLKVDKLASTVDVMANTASSANTDIQQLGIAMSYAAPNAQLFGADLAETSALIGVMSNAGVKADKAGTAARGALLRLAAPPKAAKEALDELGISVMDTQGNMLDIVDIFDAIAEKLDLNQEQISKIVQADGDLESMGQGKQIEALKAIFGTTAVSGGAAALGQLDEFKRLTLANKAAISNSQDLAELLKAQGVQQTKDDKDIYSALIRVAPSYADAVDIIESANRVLFEQNLGTLSSTQLDSLSSFFAAENIIPKNGESLFDAVLRSAGNSEDAISKLTAAMGQLNIAFKRPTGAARTMAQVMEDTLGGSFRSFSSAFESVKVAIIEPLVPLFRLLLQATTGFLLFISNLPKPVLFLISSTLGLIAVLGVLAISLGAAGVALFSFQKSLAIANLASTSLASGLIPLTGFFDASQKGFMGTNAIETFLKNSGSLLFDFRKALTNVFAETGSGIVSLTRQMRGLATAFLGVSRAALFSPLGATVLTILTLNTLIEQLVPGFNLIGFTLKVIAAPLGFVFGLIKGIASSFIDLLSQLQNSSQRAINPFVKNINNVFTNITESLTSFSTLGEDLGRKIGGFITSVLLAPINFIQEKWENLVTRIRGILQPLIFFARVIGQQLISLLAQNSPGPTEMIPRYWEMAVEKINNFISRLVNFARDAGQRIGAYFIEGLNHLKESLPGILKGIVGVIFGVFAFAIRISIFRFLNVNYILPFVKKTFTVLSQRLIAILASNVVVAVGLAIGQTLIRALIASLPWAEIAQQFTPITDAIAQKWENLVTRIRGILQNLIPSSIGKLGLFGDNIVASLSASAGVGSGITAIAESSEATLENFSLDLLQKLSSLLTKVGVQLAGLFLTIRSFEQSLVNNLTDSVDFFGFVLLTLASLPLTLAKLLKQEAVLFIPELRFLIERGIGRALAFSLPAFIAGLISTGTIAGIEESISKFIRNLPTNFRAFAQEFKSNFTPEIKSTIESIISSTVTEIAKSILGFPADFIFQVDFDSFYESATETIGQVFDFISSYSLGVGETLDEVNSLIREALKPILEFQVVNFIPPIFPLLTLFRPLTRGIVELFYSPTLRNIFLFITKELIPTLIRSLGLLTRLFALFFQAIIAIPLKFSFNKILESLNIQLPDLSSLFTFKVKPKIPFSKQVTLLAQTIGGLLVNAIKKVAIQVAKTPIIGEALSSVILQSLQFVQTFLPVYISQIRALAIEAFNLIKSALPGYVNLFTQVISGIKQVVLRELAPLGLIIARIFDPRAVFRLLILYFRTGGFRRIFKPGIFSINPFDLFFSVPGINEVARLISGVFLGVTFPKNIIESKTAEIFEILASPKVRLQVAKMGNVLGGSILPSLESIIQSQGLVGRLFIRFAQVVLLISPLSQIIGRVAITTLFWYSLLKPLNKEILDTIRNATIFGVSLAPVANVLAALRFIVVDLVPLMVRLVKGVYGVIVQIINLFKIAGKIGHEFIRLTFGFIFLGLNLVKATLGTFLTLLAIATAATARAVLTVLNSILKFIRLKFGQYGDAVGYLLHGNILPLVRLVASDIAGVFIGIGTTVIGFLGGILNALIHPVATFLKITAVFGLLGAAISVLFAATGAYLISLLHLDKVLPILAGIGGAALIVSQGIKLIGSSIGNVIFLFGLLIFDYKQGFPILNQIISKITNAIGFLDKFISFLTKSLGTYFTPQMSNFVANLFESFIKNIPLILAGIFLVSLVITRDIGKAFNIVTQSVIKFVGAILTSVDAIARLGDNMKRLYQTPRTQLFVAKQARNIRGKSTFGGFDNPFAYSQDAATQQQAMFLTDQKIAKAEGSIKFIKQINKERRKVEKELLRQMQREARSSNTDINRRIDLLGGVRRRDDGFSYNVEPMLKPIKDMFGRTKYELTDVGISRFEKEVEARMQANDSSGVDLRRRIADSSGLNLAFENYDGSPVDDKYLKQLAATDEKNFSNLISKILNSFDAAMRNINVDSFQADELFVNRFNLRTQGVGQQGGPLNTAAFDMQVNARKDSKDFGKVDSQFKQLLKSAPSLQELESIILKYTELLKTQSPENVQSRATAEIKALSDDFIKKARAWNENIANPTIKQEIEQIISVLGRYQSMALVVKAPPEARDAAAQGQVRDLMKKYGRIFTVIDETFTDYSEANKAAAKANTSFQNLENVPVGLDAITQGLNLASNQQKSLLTKLLEFTGIPQFIENFRLNKELNKRVFQNERRIKRLTQRNEEQVRLFKKQREMSLAAIMSNDGGFDYYDEASRNAYYQAKQITLKERQFIEAFIENGRKFRVDISQLESYANLLKKQGTNSADGLIDQFNKLSRSFNFQSTEDMLKFHNEVIQKLEPKMKESFLRFMREGVAASSDSTKGIDRNTQQELVRQLNSLLKDDEMLKKLGMETGQFRDITVQSLNNLRNNITNKELLAVMTTFLKRGDFLVDINDKDFKSIYDDLYKTIGEKMGLMSGTKNRLRPALIFTPLKNRVKQLINSISFYEEYLISETKKIDSFIEDSLNSFRGRLLIFGPRFADAVIGVLDGIYSSLRQGIITIYQTQRSRLLQFVKSTGDGIKNLDIIRSVQAVQRQVESARRNYLTEIMKGGEEPRMANIGGRQVRVGRSRNRAEFQSRVLNDLIKGENKLSGKEEEARLDANRALLAVLSGSQNRQQFEQSLKRQGMTNDEILAAIQKIGDKQTYTVRDVLRAQGLDLEKISGSLAKAMGITKERLQKDVLDNDKFSSRMMAPLQLFYLAEMPKLLGAAFKDVGKLFSGATKAVISDLSAGFSGGLLMMVRRQSLNLSESLAVAVGKVATGLEGVVGSNFVSNFLGRVSDSIARRGTRISNYLQKQIDRSLPERTNSWTFRVLSFARTILNRVAAPLQRAAEKMLRPEKFLTSIRGFIGKIRSFFSKSGKTSLKQLEQQRLSLEQERTRIEERLARKNLSRFEREILTIDKTRNARQIEQFANQYNKLIYGLSSNILNLFKGIFSAIAKPFRMLSSGLRRIRDRFRQPMVSQRRERINDATAEDFQRYQQDPRRGGLFEIQDNILKTNQLIIPKINLLFAKVSDAGAVAALKVARFFTNASRRVELAWEEGVRATTGKTWNSLVRNAYVVGRAIVRSLNHGAADVTAEAWQRTENSTEENMHHMAQTAQTTGGQIAHSMEASAQKSAGYFRRLGGVLASAGRAGMAAGGLITATGFAAQTITSSLSTMGLIDEKVSQSLSKFLEIFTLVGAIAGLAAPILGLLSTLFGFAIEAVIFVGSSISGLFGLITSLGTLITSVFSISVAPLIAGLGAVSLLVAGIYFAFKTNFLGIQDLTRPIFQRLLNAFTMPIQWIEAAWQGFVDRFGAKLWPIVKPALDIAQSLINALNHNPTERIPEAWEGMVLRIRTAIADWLISVRDSAGKLASLFSDGAYDALIDFIDPIQPVISFFDRLILGIKSRFVDLLSELQSIFTDLVIIFHSSIRLLPRITINSLFRTVSSLVDIIRQSFSLVLQLLRGNFTEALSTVSSLVDSIFVFLARGVILLGVLITDFLIVPVLLGIEALAPSLLSLFDSISPGVSKFGENVVAVFDSVRYSVSDLFGFLVDLGREFIGLFKLFARGEAYSFGEEQKPPNFFQRLFNRIKPNKGQELSPVGVAFDPAILDKIADSVISVGQQVLYFLNIDLKTWRNDIYEMYEVVKNVVLSLIARLKKILSGVNLQEFFRPLIKIADSPIFQRAMKLTAKALTWVGKSILEGLEVLGRRALIAISPAIAVVQERFSDFWEIMNRISQTSWRELAKYYQGIPDFLENISTPLIYVSKLVFDAAIEIGNALGEIGNKFMLFANAVIYGSVEDIGRSFNQLVDSLGNLFSQLFKELFALFAYLPVMAYGAVSQAWGLLTSFFSGVTPDFIKRGSANNNRIVSNVGAPAPEEVPTAEKPPVLPRGLSGAINNPGIIAGLGITPEMAVDGDLGVGSIISGLLPKFKLPEFKNKLSLPKLDMPTDLGSVSSQIKDTVDELGQNGNKLKSVVTNLIPDADLIEESKSKLTGLSSQIQNLLPESIKIDGIQGKKIADKVRNFFSRFKSEPVDVPVEPKPVIPVTPPPPPPTDFERIERAIVNSQKRISAQTQRFQQDGINSYLDAVDISLYKVSQSFDILGEDIGKFGVNSAKALFRLDFKGFRDELKYFSGDFLYFLEGAYKGMQGLFLNTIAAGVALGTALIPGLIALGAVAFAAAVLFGNLLGLRTVIKGISRLFIGFGVSASGAVIGVINTFKSLKTILQGVMQGIFNGDFSLVNQGLKELRSTAIETIRVVKSGFKIMELGLNDIFSGLRQGAEQIIRFLRLDKIFIPILQRLKSQFLSSFEAISQIIVSTFKFLKNTLYQLFKEIFASVRGVVRFIVRIIDFFANKLESVVLSIGKIPNTVISAFNRISQAIAQFKSNLETAFKSFSIEAPVISQIQSISQEVSRLTDKITAKFTKTKGAITGLFGRLRKDSKLAGEDIQGNLSEASPGPTYWIRKNWQKTIAFIEGNLNGLVNKSQKTGADLANNLSPKPTQKGAKPTGSGQNLLSSLGGVLSNFAPQLATPLFLINDFLDLFKDIGEAVPTINAAINATSAAQVAANQAVSASEAVKAKTTAAASATQIAGNVAAAQASTTTAATVVTANSSVAASFGLLKSVVAGFYTVLFKPLILFAAKFWLLIVIIGAAFLIFRNNMSGLGKAFQVIGDFLQLLFDNVSQVFSTIGETIGNVLNSILLTLVNVFSAIIAPFRLLIMLFDDGRSSAGGLGQAIINFLLWPLRLIVNIINFLIKVIGGIINALIKVIGGIIVTILTPVSLLVSLIAGVMFAIKSQGYVIAKIFDDILTRPMALAYSFFNMVGMFVLGIFSTIGRVMGAITSIVAGLLKIPLGLILQGIYQIGRALMVIAAIASMFVVAMNFATILTFIGKVAFGLKLIGAIIVLLGKIILTALLPAIIPIVSGFIALAPAILPILAIFAALVAVAWVLNQVFGFIFQIFSGLFSGIVAIFQDVFGTIMTELGNIWNMLVDLGKTIIKPFEPLMNLFGGGSKGGGNFFGAGISLLINTLLSPLRIIAFIIKIIVVGISLFIQGIIWLITGVVTLGQIIMNMVLAPFQAIFGIMQEIGQFFVDLVAKIPFVGQFIKPEAEAPQKFSTGGLVKGPGTSTNDRVPILASAREYVINAASTAKHLPLIELINGGGNPAELILGTFMPVVDMALSQSSSLLELAFDQLFPTDLIDKTPTPQPKTSHDDSSGIIIQNAEFSFTIDLPNVTDGQQAGEELRKFFEDPRFEKAVRQALRNLTELAK